MGSLPIARRDGETLQRRVMHLCIGQLRVW